MIDRDDQFWHYVALFPLLTKDNESSYQQKVVDPVRKAQGLFTKRAWEGSDADAKEGIAPVKTKFREGLS